MNLSVPQILDRDTKAKNYSSEMVVADLGLFAGSQSNWGLENRVGYDQLIHSYYLTS